LLPVGDLPYRLGNLRKTLRFSASVASVEEILELLKEKALEISINFYLMNSNCKSREDRYRIEPYITTY
jgi:hypothetical protein